MSDIAIRLDGLLAFLVAAGLGSILLLAALSCFLRGLWKAQRLSRSLASPHVRGMALSGVVFVAIALTVALRDGGPYPRTVEQWLDRWVVAWAVAVLLLWPLTARLFARSTET